MRRIVKKSIPKPVKKIIKFLLKGIHPKYQLNFLNKGTINFIDVGSLGGLPFPWNRNSNRINFLLNFDPSDDHVSGKNFVTYNTALWEVEEARQFYIHGIDERSELTGSSLLKQNFDYVKKNWNWLRKRGPQKLAETWFERSTLVDTKQVVCRPLDDIIEEDFSERPFHVLKIDAQGAEYNILKGAHNLLNCSLIALHLELFTLPLYQDLAMMDEVTKFLGTYGFELAHMYPPHGTFDSQHDCVFLHKTRNSEIRYQIEKIYGLK